MKQTAMSYLRGPFAVCCTVLVSVAFLACSLRAQTSIQIVSPINQRASAAGTGYADAAVDFDTYNVTLNCSASPIVAMLSSTADGKGNLLVDNNINVTVTAGGTTTGPTNVCTGGVNGSTIGIPFENCFSKGYEFAPAGVSYLDKDPDTFAATGGVPPFSIASLLVPGTQQVVVSLQDEGFYLASSTIYLNTNCTQSGVTGPALVSGNPISSSNPTADQISQDFSFNPLHGQQIGFEYDLTAALEAGSLNIADGTIPQVGDMPVDPATFQSQYVPQTSFATSSCLVHSGEVLPNGAPACKIYTLECKVGVGAAASGAQCPTSSESNEIFKDVFDGPAFSLSDIVTPNGTFHEGVGLLMANEGWTGGPCTFDPAANLGTLDCPQNLLTSFSGSTDPAQLARAGRSLRSPGILEPTLKSHLGGRPRVESSGSGTTSYSGTGRTTRPNSTFISIFGVPEPLTTVSLPGAYAGVYSPDSGGSYAMNWFKGSPNVSFSVVPPNLTGVNLPGASAFVPSPILNLTYGTNSYNFPTYNYPPQPVPGAPIPGEVTVTDSLGCPTSAGSAPPAFTPPVQTLSGLSEGTYLLHYFAADCAGTEELQFTQDSSGNWQTSFFTIPIGVDNTAPTVSAQIPPFDLSDTGGQLLPGYYNIGDQVDSQISCYDALSGVKTCDPGYVDTSYPGTRSTTLSSSDNVGNVNSTVFQYTVLSPPAVTGVQVALTASTVTYPGRTIATVKVGPGIGAPTGTVLVVLDANTQAALLGEQTLTPAGHGFAAAYFNLPGIGAGQHTLTAILLGGSGFNYGMSASSNPIPFHVLPAPAALRVSCVNPVLPFGGSFSCNAYTTPRAAGATGSIVYQLDGGSPQAAALSGGVAAFTIPKPPAGPHTVVLSYTPQPNYVTPAPQTIHFTVLPAH